LRKCARSLRAGAEPERRFSTKSDSDIVLSFAGAGGKPDTGDCFRPHEH
jgi:hypothetical protein